VRHDRSTSTGPALATRAHRSAGRFGLADMTWVEPHVDAAMALAQVEVSADQSICRPNMKACGNRNAAIKNKMMLMVRTV
jgi:hypothetical protein